MTEKNDPGAVAGATGAGGNQVRGQRLPDTVTELSGPILPEALADITSGDPEYSIPAVDQEDEPDHPLPWLANLSLTEYEPVRRRLAHDYGWRVATLDRLYRKARHKAGAPR